MSFLNDSLNKQVISNAKKLGYTPGVFQINDVFTKLNSVDWKDYIVEGQLVHLVDSGDHLDVVGVNENGGKYALGKMIRPESEYKHGVVLYHKTGGGKLSPLQPIILHPDESPSVEKVDSIKIRTFSGKTRLEKTAKDLDNMGKSFMPVSIAAFIILILIYMCS